jgi:hypothetical protein
LTWRLAISAEEIAVTETGMSCNDSSRLRAVTTISSSVGPAEAVPCANATGPERLVAPMASKAARDLCLIDI